MSESPAWMRMKAPCSECGEPAFRWSEHLGFCHVMCVPVEWFERRGWDSKIASSMALAVAAQNSSPASAAPA